MCARLAAIAGVLLLAGSASGFTLTKLALSGELVPGAPAGVVYAPYSFSAPLLNAAGDVALLGVQLAGAGVTTLNDSALVGPDGAGGLALVARENDPATPDGARFANLYFPGAPALDSSGNVAFTGALQGPSVNADNDHALFRTVAGVPASLLREGDSVPGGTLRTIAAVDAFSDDGRVWFKGSRVGVTGTSLWTASAASGVTRLLSVGEQAPGLPPGIDVATEMKFDVAPNGKVAIHARLGTPCVDHVIWKSNDADALVVLVKAPDPPPNDFPGVVFSAFGWPVIHPSGAIAFSGTTASAYCATGTPAIYSDAGGGLVRRIRMGDPAPGVPGAQIGLSPTGLPPIDASGDIAFLSAPLFGPGIGVGNDTGIWSTHQGVMALRAREGSAVPGLPGLSYGPLSQPSRNGAGDLLFRSTLVGPGVGSSNDDALISIDSGGAVRLVAREGDPLEVGPGDTRTIARIYASTGPYSLVYAGDLRCCRPILNDARQVVFGLDFTNGSSGLFLASLAPPPPEVPLAPWPWLVVAAATLTLWARRRASRCAIPSGDGAIRAKVG